MKIALLQSELHWLQAEANLYDFAKQIDLVSGEVSLILLPEMFSTGFAMSISGQHLLKEEKILNWMHKQAEKKGASICGSVCIEDCGKRYNRLLYVTPQKDVYRYNKRHLFRMAHEHEFYEAGTNQVILSDQGISIMPFICYDLRFPVWSRNTRLCELQIFVANWPEARYLQWKRLLQARAIENQCYVAGVNRCGTDGNGIRYNGQSAVYNWLGEACNETSENETLIEVSLDLPALAEFRKSFPAWKDADGFVLEP